MSLRARLLSFIMKRTIKKQFDNITDPVAFREKMAESEALTGKIPDRVTRTPQKAGEVPCEWVTVDGIRQDRVLLYLHGGGYVFGSPESHRDIAWRLAEAANLRVLMVDYRLAPEHPFPAALEDAVATYRWLLDQGFAPQQIALGGDSAGGGLSVATLVNLKNLGLPLPACAALLSPWVDLSASGESVARLADEDVLLTPGALASFAGFYLGDRDRQAPLASPLFADLANLPPMLIQVSSSEILLSDSERLAEAARKAGVDVSLETFEKMPHVFQVFAARIPEGRGAIKSIGAFVGQHLS